MRDVALYAVTGLVFAAIAVCLLGLAHREERDVRDACGRLGGHWSADLCVSEAGRPVGIEGPP